MTIPVSAPRQLVVRAIFAGHDQSAARQRERTVRDGTAFDPGDEVKRRLLRVPASGFRF